MRHFPAIRNIAVGVLWGVAVILIWDIGMGVSAFYSAKRLSSVAPHLQTLWKDKKWDELNSALKEANGLLVKTHTSLERIVFVSQLPILHKEIAAAKNLTGAFVALTGGAQEISTIVGGEIAPLLDRARDPSGVMSDASRQELQSALAAAIPNFELGARGFVDAGILLKRIPEDARILSIPPVRKAYDAAVAMSDFFGDIEPLVMLSPHLAGFDSERTYLVLFQNDTELRPTGGFIGNYGILRVRDGRIVDFKIDDTYNLDRAAMKGGRPPAPFPLPEQLAQPLWYFRDVNWLPDFPETAVRALQFYKEEGGTAKPNAVIALTTGPLIDLLKLTGPISLGAGQFTDKNVVDTLQSAVEVDYYKQGIPVTERKAIVNSLGQALAERLKTLSPYQLRDVLGIMRDNLDEKNMLLYDTDTAIERQYIVRNWAGEIKQASGDYLMVVDANLASLKTDPAVDRSIHYAVTARKDGRYVADLNIIYNHHGNFTWKTTRLRDYVRAYVPKGSELLSSNGAMVREKNSQPGVVLTTEESGKTVFGAFVAVEPGEIKELHLTYLLPAGVVEAKGSLENYSLYVQKQPGAAHHELEVIGPAEATVAWSPQSLAAARGANGSVSWKTILVADQQFSLTWKQP